MHRIFLLAALSLPVSLIWAQDNNLIMERKPVELPSFEAIKETAQYATPEEYAAARADTTFHYERVLYRSDGLVVSGYLYAPAHASVQKLPAIVFCRGNYVVRDQAPVLLTMMHRLAQAGFVVFAPMLRGSDEMPGHDEMGGADLQDLRHAIELVKILPAVDPNNVFLYGESRGAMMTYFALREGWPVRAAAIWGGITDLGDYLNTIDPLGKFAATVWPDYPRHKDEIVRSRSAVEWADNIHTPVLIMHGGADNSVSPMHALKIAEALTALKREYSLTIFAADNHILTRNRNQRDRMAVDWFRQHATH